MAASFFQFTTAVSGNTLTLTIAIDPNYPDLVSSFDLTLGYRTDLASYASYSGGAGFTALANPTGAGTLQIGGYVSDPSSNGIAAGSPLVILTFNLPQPISDFPLTFTQGDLGGAVQNGTADPTTPCFVQGTRILTDNGEVAVETLAPGDHVATLDGALARVRWVGRRHVDLRRHPERALAQPVRIQPGAFGPGKPSRDLLVSPEHAIYLHGKLVPAGRLAGCPGIAPDETIDATVYYHIELDEHAVLFADGLPCESWLDTGNRAMFENHATVRLHFDDRPGRLAAKPCFPIVTRGPMLAALRAAVTAAVEQVEISHPGLHRLVLAPATGAVQICSPTGGVAGDDRVLGAAVTEMWLDGISLDLADPRLGDGFHPAEAGLRWTNGAGRVALGPAPAGRATRVLVLDVATVAPADEAANGEQAA